MKNPILSCALLASASLAQVPAPISPAPELGARLQQAGSWPFDQVMYDAAGDGRLWAAGASWKACFGREGFDYVPRLTGAPHSTPLQFRVSSLRVGGRSLPFATDVAPVRGSQRVTFDRGVLRESYDLTVNEVEQCFVIDTAEPGDVELELLVRTELPEDATRPGLQFGSAFGSVGYGDAFLVRGGEKVGIETHFAGDRLHLRVPAALRGDGPVVIDPILSTQSAASASALVSPDVAYDVSNDRYLVVWEYEFSESDHDIFSVMFDAAGNQIAGSAAAIDATTAWFTHPRVANRNDVDRFLVVASSIDAMNGDRSMIYGRVRDAGGAMTVYAWAPISSPLVPGDNFLPDVGGDPDASAISHNWLVVWANSVGSNLSEIRGNFVDGDGNPNSLTGATIQAQAMGIRYWDVQVSRSNGNGIVARPQWLVVYGRSTATVSDVLGRRVSVGGAISSEVAIDLLNHQDRLPQVSSPADLGGSKTGFLATWQRPTATRAYLMVIAPDNSYISQSFDLTAQFGMGRFSSRVDSDGARFLVTASAVDAFSTLADQTRCWTLAYDGVTLVAQEGPTTLPGVVTEPEICSLRAGGGTAGGYGIVHLLRSGFFVQPMLTRYAGLTPGAMTQVVPTGCGGLAFAVGGSSALGGALQFDLSNFGTDFPGIAFGSPAPIPIAICSGCALGLRLDLPIVPTLGISTLAVAIPPDAGLVGQAFAMQGLSLGSGSCLGTFRFSDTIAFTIR